MKKEQIIEDIKNRIVTGQIPQGAWLTERGLCEEYGISRTPVREIIWNLSQLNVVEITAERGCMVRKFSVNDIIEVYNAREAIEGECARLACLSRDNDLDGRIAELKKKLESLSAYEDVKACMAVGQKVHHLLLEKANNRYLETFNQSIVTVTGIIRNMTSAHEELEEQSRLGHIEILDALARRDENACAEATRRHLRNACKAMVAYSCNQMLGE